MLTPVKQTSISELVDFHSGPFSDGKKFSHATRRIICQTLLREMLKSPADNAANIILVNETLKGLG